MTIPCEYAVRALADRVFVRAALLEPQPTQLVDEIRLTLVRHLWPFKKLDPDALKTLYLRASWYERHIMQLEVPWMIVS